MTKASPKKSTQQHLTYPQRGNLSPAKKRYSRRCSQTSKSIFKNEIARWIYKCACNVELPPKIKSEFDFNSCINYNRKWQVAWWHACHRRWEQLSSLSQSQNRRILKSFWQIKTDRSFGQHMSMSKKNRRRCRGEKASPDVACVSSWVSRSVRASKARCFASGKVFVAFLWHPSGPSGPSNWTCHNSVSGWRCPCPQHAVHLLNLCVHLVKTVNGYIDMSYDDIWWHGDDSMILCDSMISNLNPLNHCHGPSCPTGRLRLLGFRRWLRIQFSSSLERARWLEETSTNIIRLFLFYVYVIVHTFLEREMYTQS